jgi:hypothetical protein
MVRKARKDAEKLEEEINEAERNAENNDPPTSPIDYEKVEIESNKDYHEHKIP